MTIRWETTLATSCRLLAALILVGCAGELEAPGEGWIDDEGDAGAEAADEEEGDDEPWPAPDAGSGEADGGPSDDGAPVAADGGAPEDPADEDGGEGLPEDPVEEPPSDGPVLLCTEVEGECLMRSDCPAGTHMHEEAECMGPKTCCVSS